MYLSADDFARAARRGSLNGWGLVGSAAAISLLVALVLFGARRALGSLSHPLSTYVAVFVVVAGAAWWGVQLLECCAAAARARDQLENSMNDTDGVLALPAWTILDKRFLGAHFYEASPSPELLLRWGRVLAHAHVGDLRSLLQHLLRPLPSSVPPLPPPRPRWLRAGLYLVGRSPAGPVVSPTAADLLPAWTATSVHYPHVAAHVGTLSLTAAQEECLAVLAEEFEGTVSELVAAVRLLA